MDRAEALSVKAKTGDMEQMGEVISILRGKEDAAFDIFCDSSSVAGPFSSVTFC